MTINSLSPEQKKDYLYQLLNRCNLGRFKIDAVHRGLSRDDNNNLFFMIGRLKVAVTPVESRVTLTISTPTHFSVNRFIPFTVSFRDIDEDFKRYMDVTTHYLKENLKQAIQEVKQAELDHDKYIGGQA